MCCTVRIRGYRSAPTFSPCPSCAWSGTCCALGATHPRHVLQQSALGVSAALRPALPAFLRMVWDVLRFGREAPKARAEMQRAARRYVV